MIADFDLDRMEREALGAPDSLMTRYVADLVSEVRRLRHELNDPNYSYAGRIHRQSIISRNAEIDRLRAELHTLKDASKPAEPIP